MRVEVIDMEQTKNEAKKYILKKIPLVSKVFQFNSVIGDIKLEYIEFKVLIYEVISKKKNNKIFRNETKKETITMLVNTYNGHSESIDKIPNTLNKYISTSKISYPVRLIYTLNIYYINLYSDFINTIIP